MKRSEQLQVIASLVGEAVVTVEDAQSGWPGLVRVRVDDGDVLVTMQRCRACARVSLGEGEEMT